MSTTDISTTAPQLPRVEHLYTVEEVAKAIGRSERWVKNQLKERGFEHTMFGVSKRFTLKQFEAFRDSYIVTIEPVSITTGTAKS